MKQKRRVGVYDWVRLIATILVVLGHSAYLSMSTEHGGVTYELPESINPIYNIDFFDGMVRWIYGFHMPLFFMLSGAVFALKPLGSMDSIVRNKIKRLVIPYLFYGCFFMLPMKRLGNFFDNSSLKQALKGFLIGEDAGHLWFLLALFWCIIVFAIIKKSLERLGIQSIYIILFISIVIYYTCGYIPFDVLILKTGLRYLIYFTVGYIFEHERKNHDRYTMRKLIVVGVLLLVLEVFNERFDVINSFFAVLVGCFFVFIISDISDRAFPNVSEKKQWNVIIRNLFYVYLLHDPIMYVILRIFMNSDLMTSAFGCVLYVLCRTIIVFALSIVLGEGITFVKKKLAVL